VRQLAFEFFGFGTSGLRSSHRGNVRSALVAVKPGAVACINASINQIWSSLFHSMLSGYME
ncbi:hypothetical protein MLJ58_10650, partial [Escherichia coli]|nr:hypothetical protein [Escherichia coli]